MVNLPIEIWICHILPKTDEISLFSIIELLCVGDTLFWKKRIEDKWIMNTVTDIDHTTETYLDIVNQWNTFIKPFTDYELLYAEKGCSCKSPYHLCLLQDSLIKPVLCMPNFIKREWMEKQEILVFRTMQDILNWRCH